jgi:hypothetical protein
VHETLAPWVKAGTLYVNRRDQARGIFDPVGQGERLQCVGPDLKPKHGVGVQEHLHVGNQQVLVGHKTKGKIAHGLALGFCY